MGVRAISFEFVPENTLFHKLDQLPAYWLNQIQELLSGMQPHLRLTQPTNTSLRITAGPENGYKSATVNGLFRYISANSDAAHPGGTAGNYDVLLIASASNIVSTPEPFTDNTDYNFYLKIVVTGEIPTGNTPAGHAIAATRKIGEVIWDGTKIVGFTQFTGVGDTTAPLQPESPNANAWALRVVAASSQAASIVQVMNSAKTTTYFQVSTTGTSITGSLSVSGATTLEGVVSYSAPLDLSAVTGTSAAVGTVFADKLSLYSSGITGYGFGVQSGRLVAYVPSTGSVGFAVRRGSETGNASSGTDAVTLFAAGRIRSIGNPNPIFEAKIAEADTAPLFTIASGATLNWGVGGSTATDVSLGRISAAKLKITGKLEISETLNVSGTTTGTSFVGEGVSASNTFLGNKLVVADTAFAFRVKGGGLMEWGVGGSTAPDVVLERFAAETLRVGGKFIISGTTTLGGGLVHTGGTVGLYGATPVGQSTGWGTPTPPTSRKTALTHASTTENIIDYVMTIAEILHGLGILGS